MNDPVKDWYIKLTPGMNNKADEQDLAGKYVKLAQNLRYESEPGAVTKRAPLAKYNSTVISGIGQMIGTYRLYGVNGTKTVAAFLNKLYVGDDLAGTFTSIKTLSTSGNRMVFTTYKGLMIAGNAQDNLIVYDGSDDNLVWELGSCKAKTGSGTGITRTLVSYKIGIVVSGVEYICGTVSNEIASLSNQSVDLSFIPLGPVGPTTARKIYRKSSETGGSWKLVTTLANNIATTYSDTTGDASGGAAIGAVTDVMPKGNILKIHRERLFVSGDPNNQNFIYYSNPYLPGFIQQTTNLDYLSIAPDDGDRIMGLGIQVGTMVVIKHNTIRKTFVASAASGADPTTWYSDDPLVFLGASSQWSIVETPAGTVFLGNDGWYCFDGANLRRIIDEFDTAEILPSLYSEVVCHFSAGILYAAYGDLTQAAQYNNRVMVYNFIRDKWSVDTLNVSCFMSQAGSGDNNELFLGDSTQGYLYRLAEGDINYKLRTKSQAEAGTKSATYVGGLESSPTIQIGSSVAASSIPSNIIIFWDDEVTNPGAGWTEVTAANASFIYIDAIGTAGTLTFAETTHTHTISGNLTQVSPSQVNNGNAIHGSSPFPHSHIFSGSTSATYAVPRHIKFRMFAKNGTTTEYQFPVGAIVLWDQAAAPEGWQVTNGAGYYVRVGTTDLGITVDSNHQHTFSIESSADSPNGVCGNDADAASASGHTHFVTGTAESTTNNTWELDNVSFRLIKRIGEEAAWDGTYKYAYALYNTTGTPGNGWEEMTSTYSTGSGTKPTALFHFDGDNESQNVVEEFGKTVTVPGTAKISTTQSVFGGAGFYMDGTTVPATLADHVDWYFPGDFTIADRVRLDSIDRDYEILSQGTTPYWRFYWDHVDLKLKFIHVGSSGTILSLTADWVPAVDTWYEVRVCRSGDDFYIFANGTSLTTNWTNTNLIDLKFNGTNGQTTTTDSSPNAYTISRNGAVVIDTSQSVSGGSSSYFPLFVATSNYWAANTFKLYGQTKFTLQFDAKWESNSANENYFYYENVNAFAYMALIYDSANTRWRWLHSNGAVAINFSSWAPTLNVWYHISLEWTGTSYILKIDNVQVGATGSNSNPLPNLSAGAVINDNTNDANRAFNGWIDNYKIGVTNTVFENVSGTLSIGAYGSTYTKGYMDELIIWNGYATNTSSYTLATSATVTSGRWLKVGDSIPTTGSAINASHSHIVYNGSSANNTQMAGDGGYRAKGVDQHSHPFTVDGSSTGNTNLPEPKSYSYRLFRKVLGQMQTYNKALLQSYTTIDACDAGGWADGSGGDVTLSTDSTIQKEGTGCEKLVVGAGAGVELLAYHNITSKDISTYTNVGFWFYSTVALAAGDIQFLLDNSSNCASPLETLNLPACTANSWTYANLTPATPGSLAAVISFGFKQAVDKGAFVLYIDDVVAGFKHGTWTSPALKINAQTLGKLYWNATAGASDTIIFNTRTGATQAACELAAWSSDITVVGSQISSTPNVWLQYRIEFQAPDTTVSNPTVYFSGDYAVKFNYVKSGTISETAVEFIYQFGAVNFDAPMIDKIFKSIVSNHAATGGQLLISWKTDYDETGTFIIDLSRFPKKWQSFFPSNCFGKAIDLTFYKNDLENLTLKEVQGLYTPQPVLL